MHGNYLCASLVSLLGSQLTFAHPQSEWKDVSQADGLDIVWGLVAFHQPRVEEAESMLMSISDPSSDRFGQYLNNRAVEELFAPSDNSKQKVLAWLKGAGIDTASIRLKNTAAVMEFSAGVDQLEDLFRTKYHILQDTTTGERRLEPSAHEVPTDLEDYVQFVALKPSSPTSQTKRSRSASSKPPPPSLPYKIPVAEDLSKCDLSWTPECIRKLYGIPLGTKASPNNSLGIFGFGDAYNQADLDNFYSKYVKFIPKGTKPKVNSINGAKAPGDSIDGEESLDLQMAYPIVWPQKVTIFQTPYNNAGGLANDFLDAVDASYCHYDGGDDPNFDPKFPVFGGFQGPAMCGKYQVTNVVSISFAIDESSVSQHYVQRQCHEWMKLALRGVTVLVSAGDRGVSGNMGCMANPKDQKKEAFNPMFPGSCPYVTTIGATQVNFDGALAREVAVYDPKHNFYSGGGFSNFNTRPAYQQKAVASYLAAHDPRYPKGTFNSSGRAYPDVALLGANVTMSDGGKITVSGGTSAAAPMFAAMINRINDERLLAGKKPIGFLNQILYQHPEIFTDITDGHNPGCGTKGFQATKGWDPVSGLGSPKFPKLRDLLVGLP
ncbi:peptidase S8/S53 domain-containing protein [Dactylonectria estremocensis]|uniref:Peptidase S8/S53 domain-containing protein n=1 Tax=Dactylonectria estremocensis TaxID=1079267 RepID=A0A9P9J125_9HYPO|nr:peptidase S8/S53 domain-containing protein [Dactylonectria estremocensis]